MVTEHPNFYAVNLLTDADLDGIFDAPKQGVYFLPNRTGMGWFHKAIAKSHGMVFLRGEDAVLLAIGADFDGILQRYANLGFYVRTERAT